MNPFIYETEGIQCNCFNNYQDSKHSGLKPSRNIFTYNNPLVFHRATKSTQSKVQKEQASRIKTSLRRQKPKTPNQSTYQLNITQKPQTVVGNLNERLSVMGKIESGKPKSNDLNHPYNFDNQQKGQNNNMSTQAPMLSEKRPTLSRNQAPKQNHQNFKADFNQIQNKKLSQPIANNPVRIVYQNNYQGYSGGSNQLLKGNPKSQVNSTKNINIHQTDINQNIYTHTNSNSNHMIHPNHYTISNRNPNYTQNSNSTYNHPYNINPPVHSNTNSLNFNPNSNRLSNPNLSAQFNNINFQKNQKTVKFFIQNPISHPSTSSIPSSINSNHHIKLQYISSSTPYNQYLYRKQSFQTPAPPDNKTSRNSKLGSLKGSGYEYDEMMQPQPQPFRMMLKQIQSVADENEIFDDEKSEVIGRGWQQYKRNSSFENSYQEIHKDEILRTQTHVTRASHINNSSGIYQNQNHHRK